MAFGDPELKKERLDLINSCINIDKGKKSSKYNILFFNLFNFFRNKIQPIEMNNSFKPFSVDEFIENKISLNSKIDEMFN